MKFKSLILELVVTILVFPMVSYGDADDFSSSMSRLYITVVPSGESREVALEGIDAPGILTAVYRLKPPSDSRPGALVPILVFNNVIPFDTRVSPNRSFIVLKLFHNCFTTGQSFDGRYIVHADDLSNVSLLRADDNLSLGLKDLLSIQDGQYSLAYYYLTNEEFDRLRQIDDKNELEKYRDATVGSLLLLDPTTLKRKEVSRSEWNSLTDDVEMSVDKTVQFVAKGFESTEVTIAPPMEMLEGVKRLYLKHNSPSHLLLRADNETYFLKSKSTQQWMRISDGIRAGRAYVVDDCLVRCERPKEENSRTATWHFYELATRRTTSCQLEVSPDAWTLPGDYGQFGRILMVNPDYILAFQRHKLLCIPRDGQGHVSPRKQWKTLVEAPEVNAIQAAFFGPETPPAPHLYPDDRPLTDEEMEKLRKHDPEVTSRPSNDGDDGDSASTYLDVPRIGNSSESIGAWCQETLDKVLH